MRRIRNTKRRQRVINLPTKTLYLAPRGLADLTEEEFDSIDVQNMIKRGYLRVVGGVE